MIGHRDRQRRLAWLLGWLVLLGVVGFTIVRYDIALRRDAFQADAGVAHRLLSQRAVQLDAILETLVLLDPATDRGERPEQRLIAVHPQVLEVIRRGTGEGWPDAAFAAAEERSRAARGAALGPVDVVHGQYALVLAGQPSSYALRVDLQRMVPWDEWPLERAGPVSVALAHAGQAIVLQPGEPTGSRPAGLTPGFAFARPLASASQPFELRLLRATGPAEWPWRWLVAWAVLAAAALGALATGLHGRRERRRAEELLRIGQVARLNTLGELAGGIAHELNQPLTAVIAGTQAARRLLDDDPPELDTARQAMTQAAAQARRAADVVARLRRLVEAPDGSGPRHPVRLESAIRNVMDLLEPELRRRGIRTLVQGQGPVVLADPVALEQIVHNLLGNAMQALEDVRPEERRLELQLDAEPGQGVLTVRDTGPGIAPDSLFRVFEPFYTTRRGGLGLGLSLCETLAQAMQGTLSARNAVPRGAEFRLALPLAPAAA